MTLDRDADRDALDASRIREAPFATRRTILSAAVGLGVAEAERARAELAVRDRQAERARGWFEPTSAAALWASRAEPAEPIDESDRAFAAELRAWLEDAEEQDNDE